MANTSLANDVVSDIARAFDGVTISKAHLLSIEELRFDGFPISGSVDGDELGWRGINPLWIEYNYDALAICTSPLDFQFMLPAYMTVAVRSVDSKTNVPSFVIYSLYPTKLTTLRFVAFTTGQCRVICRVLNFLLAYYAPGRILPELSRAIDYWTKRYHRLTAFEP